MGELDGSQPLEAILEGESMRALRRDLLEGRLNPTCEKCPARGWTPIENLRERVEAYRS